MPLAIERPQRELVLAGKVASVSEIRTAILLESKARLDIAHLKQAGPDHKAPSVVMKVTSKSAGRLVPENLLQATLKFKLTATQEDVDKHPVFEITSVYLFEYELAEGFKPTPEELNAFVSNNGLFNCWPFWRELVQNTAMRMGLPPLTLPFFRIRSKVGKAPVQKSKHKGGESNDRKD